MLVGAIVTVTGSYAVAWALLAVGVVAGALILPPLPLQQAVGVRALDPDGDAGHDAL
jgi:hypothetical protein